MWHHLWTACPSGVPPHKACLLLLKCRTLLYLLWSPPHCTPIHLRLLDWHKPLPWLNHVTIDRLSDGYLRCWWQRRGSFMLVNLRKKHQNGSGDCGVKLRIRSSFSTNLHRSVPLWIECATKDWSLVFLRAHAHLAVGINFGWWVERRNLRTMFFLKNGPSPRPTVTHTLTVNVHWCVLPMTLVTS